MNVDQSTKLIEVLVAFLQALSWPLIVVFILLYFGAPLKKFLNDIGEFTFKAGASGLEATAKRQQIEAAALLGAASASKAGEVPEDERVTEEEKAREIANVVSQAAKPKLVKRLAESEVLWVDDFPMNINYERKALEALGIRFTLATSTEEALLKLRQDGYNVIISDMGRPSDNKAGYTLLGEIRRLGYTTPFIIYSSSNLPEHKAEARRRGAFGSTNDPQELFQMVLGALQSE